MCAKEKERGRKRKRTGKEWKRERKERKILGLKTNRKSERRRKENERGRVREKNTKKIGQTFGHAGR